MAISAKADLLGEWTDNGYALFDDYGDLSLSLYYKGGYIRSFDKATITKEMVGTACQEHWNRLISQEAY